MRVCIVAEGSYPIVRGGVSEWTHQLISGLPKVDFDVFCLAPSGEQPVIYPKLPNVRNVHVHAAVCNEVRRKTRPARCGDARNVFGWLEGSLHGTPIDCSKLASFLRTNDASKEWLLQREYWDYLVSFYEKTRPQTDFAEFFWTNQGTFSNLIDAMILAKRLPEADVYHALTTGLGGVVASIGARLNGVPLVVSEHGMYMKERSIDLSRQQMSPSVRELATDFFMSLVRTSYENADFLLPICQNYADNEVSLGARPNKIRVLFNGIDVRKFTVPESRQHAVPTIGCFARVVPLKDQITLIRAAKKVLESHRARFVVVGEFQDKEYYEECMSLVHELGLEESVQFVGHSDRVVDWYHNCDIFVLSSRTEGLPLALLEAMSTGLPCVCTAVGGVPEVVANNGVGFVVQPGDSDALAERISLLVANEGLRKRMGEQATRIVREKFTVETMVEQVLEIYYEAVALSRIKVAAASAIVSAPAAHLVLKK